MTAESKHPDLIYTSQWRFGGKNMKRVFILATKYFWQKKKKKKKKKKKTQGNKSTAPDKIWNFGRYYKYTASHH